MMRITPSNISDHARIAGADPNPKRQGGAFKPVARATGSDRCCTFAYPDTDSAHGHPRGLKPAAHLRGFTLIEMTVVIAIILIILGLVLPAATTLWNERKAAEAENTMQGLLMTSRARAMRAEGIEAGLLAFVDDKGVQRLVSIAKASPSEDDLAGLTPSQRVALQRAFDERIFEITDDRDHALPAPMRVVPRYVVNEPDNNSPYTTFEPYELANEYFDDPPDEADEAQRHRNYFTMIYSTDGRLLVGRDALIRDEDDDEDQVGDRAGLRVGVGPPDADPETTQYHTRSGTSQSIDPKSGLPIGFLVTDDKKVAINFSSVDGL
ncbi:MAG: prepilin-type N-terminal cleavage/methylation domain-containing protein, partial [Phycisphaerae bacterium]